MKDENIIKIDEENYNKVIVLKDELTENDYKIILAGIKIQ